MWHWLDHHSWSIFGQCFVVIIWSDIRVYITAPTPRSPHNSTKLNLDQQGTLGWPMILDFSHRFWHLWHIHMICRKLLIGPGPTSGILIYWENRATWPQFLVIAFSIRLKEWPGCFLLFPVTSMAAFPLNCMESVVAGDRQTGVTGLPFSG